MSRNDKSWRLPALIATTVLLLPDQLLADNCSSLHDCWNTVRAAATAAVAAAAAAAAFVANSFVNDVYKEIKADISSWVQRNIEPWVPSGSAYEESLKQVRDLAEGAREEQGVFEEIAGRVGEGLGSGRLPPQADGGLGQTHANYTPDGGIPFDMGTLPGISSPGAGLDRDAGAGAPSGPGGGGGESAGSHGAPTPLGGGDSPPAAPPPSYGDLGLDPASGEAFEYFPEWGIVDIYNADGTLRETIPWPPR